MFLSRIELVGFKSFANRTVFNFTKGITAIVGPNGCGKTNIVDSIRWVLGEQKTSLLRSEVMENVIFNGSSTKKPLGMAEVSITFINDKNVLPTQFNEVTVTRRLYRDGQSEYLINNTQCRLKDIVDLFLDTGIGHNSYSIIELKMIENLLNGSVEERRRLLEEAVGVAKFKLRKKETLKRMDSVRNDLQRIYDIVNEIEQQVKSLSRQASKTRRFNQIQTELKELELKLWYYQFKNYNRSLEQIEQENKLNLEEKEKQVSLYNEIVGEIKELEEKITKLEEEIEEVRSEESVLYQDFTEKRNRIGVLKEKINSIDSTLNKIAEDRKEAEILISRYQKTLKELIELKENKTQTLRDLIDYFESLKVEVDSWNQQLLEKQAEFDKSRAESVGLENELKFEKLNYNRLSATLEQLVQNKAKIEKEQERIAKEIESVTAEKKTSEDKINELSSQKSEVDKGLSELENLLNEKKNLFEQTKQRENELKIALKETQVTLEFLNSVEDTDESTKFLIKETNWKENRKFSLLSEVISIDEKYRIAYDSLLGQFKNIVLVDDETDIADAYKILTESGIGKCFFVPLNKIPENFEITAKFSDPKIIGFVWELPEVNNKIRNIFFAIFGDSVVVRDYEDALEISRKYSVPCVVTLSGELVWGKYIHKRGSIHKREGISIGKRDRIKKLEKKREGLIKDLGDIEQELKNISASIEQITSSIKNGKKTILEIESKINNFNLIHQKHEKKHSELLFQRDSLEKEYRKLIEEYEKLSSETKVVEEKIRTLSEKYSNFESVVKESKSKFEDFQRLVEEKKSHLREKEKGIVKIKTELEGLEKEILRIENGKKTQQQRIEKFENEHQSLLINREELLRKISELEVEIGDLENSLKEVRNRKNYLLERKKEYEDLLTRQQSFKEDLQFKIDKLVSKIHQNEIEATRLNENIRSLFSKALEVYNTNLNDVSFEFEESFSPEQVEGEIERLKKSLVNLGNVNFLALQEYEEQKQRLELYRKQIEDLTNSENSLKEALDEINRTAVERFLTAFDQINANFSKVFAELFGGDSFAELVIDRNDPLESDVGIRVKPAGKKINSIDTLSQGEKTLTVLSLLFALYLVKPSPFCVLDEVDAPLDDANVDRFLNLLRKFSDVQFILITHNKRTMEFANVLYGITMAEDGVSKVLSVKLVE